jgi:hypothetical protein
VQRLLILPMLLLISFDTQTSASLISPHFSTLLLLTAPLFAFFSFQSSLFVQLSSFEVTVSLVHPSSFGPSFSFRVLCTAFQSS